MEIPDHLDVIDVPCIRPTRNYAELVTPSSVKRHSWDDDALRISYDRYRRTEIVIDGRTIYEIHASVKP